MSKSITISLEPEVLKWARQRAGLSIEDLARNFTQPEKVAAWETDGKLTLKQAETLAAKTHTPFGYLYLDTPPVEKLPINDFRTVGSQKVLSPSPELLETIGRALERQEWFRDYAVSNGFKPLDFINSLTGEEEIVPAAQRLRKRLSIETSVRANAHTWEEALRLQRECLESQGILVMQSGIVGENTHRPLNVDEFRGFALSDEYAPLIFINSKDVKAAQMFTMMHELVHLCLGVSGVSNLTKTYAPNRAAERFCNAVAAEILVPAHELMKQYVGVDKITALLRHFKVSVLVILRRLRDLRLITVEEFDRLYNDAQVSFQRAEGSGGDYYNTKISRLGRRFLSALMESTLEGAIPLKEAFRLLGVSNVQTMRNLARELQFEP